MSTAFLRPIFNPTTGALFSLYLTHRPLGRTVGALLSTVTFTNLAHRAYHALLRPR